MNRSEQRAIEWDCQRTWIAFYACFDNWDYAGMLALCTPDVEWVRAGKRLLGHTQLLDELNQRTRCQTIRHSLSNMLVSVDPQDSNRASGQCHLVAWRYLHDGPVSTPPTIQHPYLFLMVRAEFRLSQNEWLIEHQEMHREFLFPEAE